MCTFLRYETRDMAVYAAPGKQASSQTSTASSYAPWNFKIVEA